MSGFPHRLVPAANTEGEGMAPRLRKTREKRDLTDSVGSFTNAGFPSSPWSFKSLTSFLRDADHD